MKTLVLSITELYRIIPTTNILEGKNFKNIEEVLKTLVGLIEDDDKWEFVQYVNNKPSLFIIREADQGKQDFSAATKKMNSLMNRFEQQSLQAKIPNHVDVYKPTEINAPSQISSPTKINPIDEEIIAAPKNDPLPWEK